MGLWFASAVLALIVVIDLLLASFLCVPPVR
jgi:hypothetical protein